VKVVYFINKERDEENEIEVSNIYFSHKRGTALLEILNEERREIYIDRIVLIKF